MYCVREILNPSHEPEEKNSSIKEIMQRRMYKLFFFS